MGLQDQIFGNSSLQDSSVQQAQAGRDAISFLNSDHNQVTISNIFLRLFGKLESAQVDWDWGMRLLEKKQLPEIRKRLTDTLGRDRTLMDVSIAEQQTWVNRSPLEADRTLQVQDEDRGRLDANRMLIEAFGRDDIAGKLLILGAPGAGKTTALLSLAEQLICGALVQPQTVIPVLVELSTWRDDNQSIHDWLIEQLYDLHGGNRKRQIYEQWLERQVLLPLLDGLDELGLKRQEKCTVKLNEFARHYPQVVVCCRVKEFETANLKLDNFNGAVCLQPLSDKQIQDYLDSLNRSEVWAAIQTTPALQTLLELTREGDPGLLRVPLFIKLAADVYDPHQPISSETDLLEKYIDRQLSIDKRAQDRRKELEQRQWSYKTVAAEPDWRQTRIILGWLAKQLQQYNYVEFLIEEMHPDCLEFPSLQWGIEETQPSWLELYGLKLRYIGLVSLFYGLFTVVGSSLVYGLFYGLTWGLIWGLAIGGTIGVFELNPRWAIEPIEAFQFSKSRSMLGFFLKAAFGLLYGLLHLLSYGLLVGLYLVPLIVPFVWFCELVWFYTIDLPRDDRLLDRLLDELLNGLHSGFDGILKSLFRGVFDGIVGGICLSLIIGIPWGALGGLSEVLEFSKKSLRKRSQPNQGIWNSLQNMLWTTAWSYPFAVYTVCLLDNVFDVFSAASNGRKQDWLGLYLVFHIVVKTHDWSDLPDIFFQNYYQYLLLGLFWAILFSFFLGGGRACVQHFCLRFILWQNGNVPWNLARFLNYCVERRLLLRVGGRYRFLHRELLDHFAQQNPNTPS